MGVGKVLKNKITSLEGLTFDDILLIPNYANFKRAQVDLTSQLHPRLPLRLPVISAPMDTVTEDKMTEAMGQMGGLGIIHRNLDSDLQAKMILKAKSKKIFAGAAIGAGNGLVERVDKLVKAGVDVIVVDSGHGHTSFIMDATSYIKKKYPKVILMSGNVSTYEGAKALIKVGADILRVGMGPGSICTTRMIAGVGTPQVTAIMETVRATEGTKVTVVADGGIQQIGDIAKALALGARAVMLGSLLARFDESPGQIVQVNGKKYKQYRGMGSVVAMKKGAAERYGQSKEAQSKKLIAEGVEGLVPYKGKVENFLYQIDGSLRSAFYYLGSRDINEFFKKAKFIKASTAGIKESHPHNIIISQAGENYLV